MRMVFAVLSVLFVNVAHADVVCTTYGNVTTCRDTSQSALCSYDSEGWHNC